MVPARFAESAAKVPWGETLHAQGAAVDTPDHLLAVWAGDAVSPEAGTAGYTHLWRDLIGQGQLWGATAPAAYLLSLLIRDPAFGEPDPTLRQGVLILFREIAIRTGKGEVPWASPRGIDDLLGHPPIESCRLVLPALLDVEHSLIGEFDTHTSACAATAAVAITSRNSVPAVGRAELTGWLYGLMMSDAPVSDRAGALLDLGDLGEVFMEQLRDPAPPMRLAAALSAPLKRDDAANEILLEFAASPLDLDTVFGEPDGGWQTLPQLGGRRVSAVVAESVCERTQESDRLVAGAQAALALVPSPGVENVILPYFKRFFPAGLPSRERATGAQKEFAAALISSQEFWDWRGRMPLLMSLNLPLGRQQWHQIIDR